MLPSDLCIQCIHASPGGFGPCGLRALAVAEHPQAAEMCIRDRFYILCGVLMNTGGIAQKLIDFAKILVGRIPGGLAHTCLLYTSCCPTAVTLPKWTQSRRPMHR